MFRKLLLASAGPIVLAFTVGSAHAQTAAPASATAAADGGVQEIVVTANRRSQNLQQVAMTVEAVPAETLKAMNITSALGLTDVVPGLVMTPAGGNLPYLRGIGSGNTGYNEVQVATYIDGLYMPNPAMSIYSFNNIDRVEVLKGPQGTLYGRNATGGLIAVTTRDPGMTRKMDASIGYGNYDTLTANFYGSTPITDSLAANLAVYHSKQSKGWGVNLFNGHDNMKSDETGVQSKLVWQPTAATRVTGSFIYDYNNRDIGYAYEVYPGTLGSDGTPFFGRYRNAARVDPSAPFKSHLASIKIEQDLGFAKLTSLSGYQYSHQTVTFNTTPNLGQPIAGQSVTTDIIIERSQTFSQEFQLSSKPSDSRLDWVAGAFLYSDNTKIEIDAFTTCLNNTAASCTPGFVPSATPGYPTTRSYSGYADATYKIFDATHLTGGLRYTDESKGLTGWVNPLPGYPNSSTVLPATAIRYAGAPYTGNPAGIPTSLHFTKWTYRIVLAQDFGDNVHAYLSDNLGFKSGAFNANAFNNPPARPEQLHSYEAGVKSEWFDRRLRLNASYFYYDYKDVQVRSTAPPALPGNAILVNAAKERQKGVDIDFNAIVMKGLSINGGVEFINSRYVDFPGTTCSAPATRVVNGVTVGSPITATCNLAGHFTPQTAPTSGTIGFLYKLDTSYGAWALNASDHFNSHFPISPDGVIKQGSHNIINASLTWTSKKGDFDVQAYGKNLGAEYSFVAGLAASAGNYTVTPGAPRTYGVTVGYHY
jgi:iron complex outermembrane receptor protein